MNQLDLTFEQWVGIITRLLDKKGYDFIGEDAQSCYDKGYTPEIYVKLAILEDEEDAK